MYCYICVGAAMYLLHMFGVIIAVMHSSSSSSSDTPVEAAHCFSAVHGYHITPFFLESVLLHMEHDITEYIKHIDMST